MTSAHVKLVLGGRVVSSMMWGSSGSLPRCSRISLLWGDGDRGGASWPAGEMAPWKTAMAAGAMAWSMNVLPDMFFGSREERILGGI